jgi:hypothetical protein
VSIGTITYRAPDVSCLYGEGEAGRRRILLLMAASARAYFHGIPLISWRCRKLVFALEVAMVQITGAVLSLFSLDIPQNARDFSLCHLVGVSSLPRVAIMGMVWRAEFS